MVERYLLIRSEERRVAGAKSVGLKCAERLRPTRPMAALGQRGRLEPILN